MACIGLGHGAGTEKRSTVFSNLQHPYQARCQLYVTAEGLTCNTAKALTTLLSIVVTTVSIRKVKSPSDRPSRPTRLPTVNYVP